MSETAASIDKSAPSSDAVLEMLDTAALPGSTCALLTPAIKAKLRELRAGQILEVRVDDLTACTDIASWCRLSGNELLSTIALAIYLLSKSLRRCTSHRATKPLHTRCQYAPGVFAFMGNQASPPAASHASAFGRALPVAALAFAACVLVWRLPTISACRSFMRELRPLMEITSA